MKKGLSWLVTILFISILLIPGTAIAIDSHIINKNTAQSSEKDNLGFHLSGLDFDHQIALYMKLGHMPSLSACIVKNNSVKWAQAYGDADRETLRGATPDSIYTAGSISKSIAAVAVMQLLEKKLITSLDDDVNNYLDFKLRHPCYKDTKITIRMLMAHESGLISYDIPMFIYFSLLGYPRSWLKEFLTPNGQYYSPLVWSKDEPGTKNHYSSLNFEIIGYLIERITHQPYEQYVRENIFEPLNMPSTSTSYFLSELNASNLVVPYTWIAGRYVRLPHYEVRTPASGGLKTTTLDLAHYLIIHMNGGVYNGTRILNSTSINEIHRGQYDLHDKDNLSFGLGWYSFNGSDGNMYGGHDGTIPGGRSVMRVRYHDNIGVIFFYNEYQFVFSREKSSPLRIIAHSIGRLEIFACQMVEKLLFEKAENL